MSVSKCLIIVLFVTFSSCESREKICSENYFAANGVRYKAVGCFLDSLENGEWKVFDSAQKLIESGRFEKGFRIGKWQYLYDSNGEDTVTNWWKYTNSRLRIATNMPYGFTTIDDTSNYVKFSGTTNLGTINIVLQIHENLPERFDVDDYYKVGDNEILERGWSYKTIKNKILSKKRTVYFNEYKISNLKGNDSFIVSNLYALMPNNKMIEVTCRYDYRRLKVARRIFFAVVGSIFISNERLLNPLDPIQPVELL